MTFFPELTFSLLNGFLLIIPLFLMRYGLPALLRQSALAELDFTPQPPEKEKYWLTVYFLTTGFLILSPLTVRIAPRPPFVIPGLVLYLVGILITAVSIVNFSRRRQGFTRHGLYRFSRNPMYVGFFLYFLGVGFLLGSWLYLLVTFVYQLSVHFLILAEERWCRQTFGQPYMEYQDHVRRYF